MKDNKHSANVQQETTPQTAEERNQQLSQIADRILTRIQHGYCTERERTQLLKQYDIIDRILQRHNAGEADADSSILDHIREILDAVPSAIE